MGLFGTCSIELCSIGTLFRAEFFRFNEPSQLKQCHSFGCNTAKTLSPFRRVLPLLLIDTNLKAKTVPSAKNGDSHLFCRFFSAFNSIFGKNDTAKLNLTKFVSF